MSYTPYGEKLTRTGPDVFHQKYTGQVDDSDETGLLYYNARYYDPSLGRFITPDSIVSDPTNSQSFNRYMYVLGNPINYNDPSGFEDNCGPGSAGPSGPAGGGSGYGSGPAFSGSGGSGSDRGGNISSRERYSSGPVGSTLATTKNGHGGLVMAGYKPDGTIIFNDINKYYTMEIQIDDGFVFNPENATEIPSENVTNPVTSSDDNNFVNPLPDNAMVVHSLFGSRTDKEGKPNFHRGIDLGALNGTKVYAVADGIVSIPSYTETYGKKIIIKHKNGFTTAYAHLSKIIAVTGRVNQGDLIGLTGQSGKPGTPQHLHFAIEINGEPVDPYSYLNF